jgi:acetyl esterase
VSPILAEDAALRATPPALVVTAEYDPLRDEGLAYAERLRDVGVEVAAVHYDSMMHGFMSLSDFLDDGKAALALAGDALATALA